MADDVTLAGSVEVVLHAASTAVDTDFVARLCAVDPDGVSIELLQRGKPRPPQEPWASMPNTGAW